MEEKGFDQEEVQGFSDGSRRGDAAASANRASAQYLGRYATVMDPELLGICLSWEEGHNVAALDSQGAVARATQLFYDPRSWIEQCLQRFV